MRPIGYVSIPVAVFLAFTLILGVPGTTAAQDENKLDINGKPNFGEVKLKSGFLPDPFKKEVVAGGNLKITIKNVTGFCTKEPDFRLLFEAGNKELVLSIYAELKADTVLFINGPDGTWYANDDRDGLNPRIDFRAPKSGRYEIWVATYGPEGAKATLHISEIKQN